MGCSSIRFSYSRNSARIDVYLFMYCVNTENTHKDVKKKDFIKLPREVFKKELNNVLYNIYIHNNVI